MNNRKLYSDYISRCHHRLAALEVLYERKSWADVVRESQEVVELALVATLRRFGIEVPRVHDVSDILISQSEVFPDPLKTHIPKLAQISRVLRRDRELAFYGTEDLTPSEFYKESDAHEARESAAWVVETVEKQI